MPTKKPAAKHKAAKPKASPVKSTASAGKQRKAASHKASKQAAKPAKPARKPNTPAQAKRAPAPTKVKNVIKTVKPAAAVKPAPAPSSPAAKPARVAKTAAAKPAAPEPVATVPTRAAATPTAPKTPVRTAPQVVATGISRGTMNRAQVEAGDGEDGEESSSLLAGPRNVQPYIAKRGEQYMNREQLGHFRQILQSWKRDLMVEVDRTVTHMKDEAANFPDPNDRATQEEEFSLELRTRDRERKLIRKIDEALKRIEDGSYGYCLETGEEIGIKRLEARPVATLSIEAQERRERRERQYGDRDDRYR
jgi:DnaK suppressor protein